MSEGWERDAAIYRNGRATKRGDISEDAERRLVADLRGDDLSLSAIAVKYKLGVLKVRDVARAHGLRGVE